MTYDVGNTGPGLGQAQIYRSWLVPGTNINIITIIMA